MTTDQTTPAAPGPRPLLAIEGQPLSSVQRSTVSVRLEGFGIGAIPTVYGPGEPLSLRLEYDGDIDRGRLQYRLSTTLYVRVPDGQILHVELLNRPAGERPVWFAEMVQQCQPPGWRLPEAVEESGTVVL